VCHICYLLRAAREALMLVYSLVGPDYCVRPEVGSHKNVKQAACALNPKFLSHNKEE